MSQKVTKPAYVYDEASTLRSLLATFVAANPHGLAGAAEALGVKEDTFTQWIDGTWTEGLRTRYFNAFVELTGIDLDRLMVTEAKRRIWERDPSLRGVVTFDRFQSRQDVIAEICRVKSLLPYGDGTRYIAWQIPEVLNSELFSQWSLGRTKPDGDNLEACLIGLSRGLVETGTRNDLAFRLAMRRVCGMELEDCLRLSTFEELVRAVFTRELKARGATIAAQQTEINVTTVADLIRWTPANEKEYPYGTIFSLVRHHVRTRWDAASQERFVKAAGEFLDKDNKAYVVTEPVRPQWVGDASANPPVAPTVVAETVPSPAPPARGAPGVRQTPETTTLDGGVRRLVAHLRTQLLQAAMDFPDVVRRLPLIPGLEVGETLHNVRWCLTGAKMPDVGNWDPSDQEIELIADAVALVRRAILLVLGLPMPVRRRVIKRLARELDELFLAFDHAGVEDLVGLAEQIGLQRKQADIVREGKR